MTMINQRSIVENLTFYDRQNLIWDCECNPKEKLVLFALNMHADSNGECFPGLKRIEQKCGIIRADRVTDRLMELGLIIKKQRFDEKGRQTSNGYQILFENLKIQGEVDGRSIRDGREIQGEVDGRSIRDGREIQGEVDGRSIRDGREIQGEVDGRSIKLDHIKLDHLKRSEITTHIDPERVCVENAKKTEQESESIVSPDRTKSLPVLSKSIGVDNFSAAAPQKTLIEGFPAGPWGRSLFEIDGGFIAWMIAQWRKGDGRQSQAFGKMADEEVRACLQKYWRKDWSTLSIDWDAYSSNTQRLVSTVSDRIAQGVEISPQEQKMLNDRIRGPEHLRPQAPYSAPQQAALNPVQVQTPPNGSIKLLPVAVTGISESELEETRRAIESARSSLMKSDQSLFEGRNPVPDFMDWLLEQAKSHRVPGMAIRAIAVTLGRRPEMQAAYLSSRKATERELSYSGSEDF